MLLTIDPGNDTGWALWTPEGLVECGLSSNVLQITATTVWIESPVVYPRSKVPPNDIVKLAREAGRMAGHYEAAANQVHFVEPAKWKGQVPKDIHHARVWAKLTPTEQDIVNKACKGLAPSKRHNVMDAVGLGLWVRSRKS